MADVNARTKPEEENNWNRKRLKQNIIDRIRHNVLYLSIKKFRIMKIFLLWKLKFNRKAEITGSSQWIAIVVSTNNPTLCLVLAITPSKWGPLIKNPKNILWKFLYFNSLKLYRIARREWNIFFMSIINCEEATRNSSHRIHYEAFLK